MSPSIWTNARRNSGACFVISLLVILLIAVTVERIGANVHQADLEQYDLDHRIKACVKGDK